MLSAGLPFLTLFFAISVLLGGRPAFASLSCEQVFDDRPAHEAVLTKDWNHEVSEGPGLFRRSAPLRLEQINYRIFGNLKQGPPLILIHGANTSHKTFLRFAEILSSERPVILYDQRGQGGTREPGPGYDIDVLSSDLLSLVNGLGIRRFDLHGHSLGGQVALRFAGEHPERVRSLSLEDVSGFPFKERHDKYVQETRETVSFLRALDGEYATPEAFAEALAPLAVGKDSKFLAALVPKGRDPYLNGPYRARSAAVVEEIMIDVCTRDLTMSHANYRGPLLMMRAGKTTRYFSDDHVARLNQIRPDALVIPIEDTGHLIHVTKPDAWLATLRGFLGQVSGD
jgi:pimeloyl-ACP methyl ester carboxylesterase